MVFVRREPSSELTPMASVASFGHIDKWICQCDTHLHTYAKAARFPPCTLPFLAQAPTLRLSHDHTSMAAALALIGCGRRSQARLDDEHICCWLYPSLIKKCLDTSCPTCSYLVIKYASIFCDTRNRMFHVKHKKSPLRRPFRNYRLTFMMYLLLAGRPRRSKCLAFSGINAGLFLRRIEVEHRLV